MTTSTASINLDIDNLSEDQKKEIDRQKRSESAKKVWERRRQAQEIKKVTDVINEMEKVQEPIQNTGLITQNSLIRNNNFWKEVFLIILQNLEVKGSKDVPKAIQITDETIKYLEEQGKI